MNARGAANSSTKCDQCGDPIETTRWHPAIIERDDERRLLTFCGQECQESWQRHGSA